MRTVRAALVVTCLAAAGACGMSGGTAPPGTAFCDRWVHDWCLKNQECCTDVSGTYTTVGRCEEALRPTCWIGYGTAFETPADGGIAAATYNPAAAAGALATLEATGCPLVVPTLDSIVPPIVTGTRHNGDDCSPYGFDLSPTLGCMPSYRCLLGATRAGVLQGRCVPEGVEGSVCSSQTCREDLYCQFASPAAPTGTCAVRGSGTSCQRDYECLGTCSIDATTHVGTCSLFSPPGAAWCLPGASTAPVMHDAGTDVDAGDVDAGTTPPDLGTDAGGPPDLGTDAGPRDAGPG